MVVVVVEEVVVVEVVVEVVVVAEVVMIIVEVFSCSRCSSRCSGFIQ